jgi:hypothetical protein
MNEYCVLLLVDKMFWYYQITMTDDKKPIGLTAAIALKWAEGNMLLHPYDEEQMDKVLRKIQSDATRGKTESYFNDSATDVMSFVRQRGFVTRRLPDLWEVSWRRSEMDMSARVENLEAVLKDLVNTRR